MHSNLRQQLGIVMRMFGQKFLSKSQKIAQRFVRIFGHFNGVFCLPNVRPNQRDSNIQWSIELKNNLLKKFVTNGIKISFIIFNLINDKYYRTKSIYFNRFNFKKPTELIVLAIE